MNRETWLNNAMQALKPYFTSAGASLHGDIRIAVGFPLGGFEKIAGQCFKRDVSKDKTNEIFISPLIDDPWRALDILVHELIHASDNCFSGHNKHFASIARALGLEGKPTTTFGGDDFKRRYKTLIAKLGDYPHQALQPSKIKRQGARLLKCECPVCGYIARVTNKWIENAGAPICPTCEEQMLLDV
jgi:hypothetical protein